MSKKIIAHRGASAYVKENTIESYFLAIDQGADMIEFDVRKTKDNILISHHDSSIDGYPIQQLSHKEISHLARKKGFEIPTLEKILIFTRGKIKLDVELKEEGYEKTVLELMRRYFQEDEFIVTSFNDGSLVTIKDLFPGIKVGLILGKKNPQNFLKTRFSEIFPQKRYDQSKADFLVVHWKLARFGILSRTAKTNIPVLIWTLNEKKRIVKFLKDKRITGMITDKPDLVISLKTTMNFYHPGD